MLKVYEILKKNQYGQYLKDVLDGKYLDVRASLDRTDLLIFDNSYLCGLFDGMPDS